LNFRIEVNGEPYAPNPASPVSVEEIAPGVFSVLLNHRSIVVHLSPHAQGTEAWAGSDRYLISLADPRDKAGASAKVSASGPAELRAQMPGKIIKLLAAAGDEVKLGQGLLIVEAMKMQNEVKSPKDGTVSKVHAAEGGTVAAGDLLMVVV
jgi:biotin carboxyl carrier protein